MITKLLYMIVFFLIGSLPPLVYLTYKEHKEFLKTKKWSKNKQL